MPRKVQINYKKTIKIISVNEINDWEKVANFLIGKMEPGLIIALQGDLGAGKTTLTQFMAKSLGVVKRALSPTFALIKIYYVRHGMNNIERLIHVDAYRIEDENELLALDLDEELLESGSVMIIEWPEKIKNWLSRKKNVIKVNIEIK